MNRTTVNRTPGTMSDTISINVRRPLIDRPSALHYSLVLAQPDVDLEPAVGFRLKAATPPQDQVWLPTAFQIARDRNATFIVFPEYSLPWASWRDLDRRVQDELPNSAVVIAGLDSVPEAGYRQLLDGGFLPGPGDPSQLGPTEWVNCCIVLVKDRTGQVTRHLQLKTSEAGQESCSGTMTRGKSLLVFEAPNFCFAILICYDLISELGDGTPLTSWVASEQDYRRIPNLDMLFAIQHNRSPEHNRFFEGFQQLLRACRVDAVVAANTAVAGHTGIYFPTGSLKVPPDAVPDSYTLEKVEGRELVRARFRTTGAALFSFDYHPPRQNQGGGVSVPLRDVFETDPRVASNGSTRGRPVPSGLWAIREFGRARHPRGDLPPAKHTRPLVQQVFEGYFDEVYASLMALDKASINTILSVLVATGGSDRLDPCHWKQECRHAIGALVRYAAILRFGGPLNFEVAPHRISFKLPFAGGKKVAVVGGGQQLPLRNLAVAYASETETRGGLLCNGCLLVVVEHRDMGGERPAQVVIRTEAQAQLAASPNLVALDAAGVPAAARAPGDQPTFGSPALLLYTYPGRGLETVLAASQTPDDVATALAEVLS